MGIGDGARLMRTSLELVRRDPALLWFPVASTCCLLLASAFWIYEGAWLYAVSGPWLLFAPLVVLGLYSLLFVGIFFNVALAGAAVEALEGRDSSLRDGLDVAWSRLGPIAGWAGYSLFVSLLVGAVESVKGLRWVGKAGRSRGASRRSSSSR